MLNAANRLERQYSTTNRYPNNAVRLEEIAALTTCPKGDANPFYTVTYENPTGDQSFLITATRQGTQLSDEKCGDLTLDNLGRRTASGSASDAVTVCWR
ncbi:MAG: type IV pilin protein [Betaproteobacteria bacterium]|nr:type IV pilin protein [Betaproteobacteria bacterium]